MGQAHRSRFWAVLSRRAKGEYRCVCRSRNCVPFMLNKCCQLLQRAGIVMWISSEQEVPT